MKNREPVTSGAVNAYPVRFEFSPDWEGLVKTAVFRAGTQSRAVLLEEGGECTVPWEVLQKPGLHLMTGVYGSRGGEMILPTVWASLGVVLEGASPGEDAQPPTPELWEQILAQSRDHRQMLNRDAEDQHPIRAVTGLQAELNRIPVPTEALTNEELEVLLK